MTYLNNQRLLNFYFRETSIKTNTLAYKPVTQPTYNNGSGAGWAGAVIGGVSGFFLGGISGALIGASLGASLGNSLAKKKDNQEKAKLPTYSFSVGDSNNLARLGQPIPLVYCNSVVNPLGGVIYSGVILSCLAENHGDAGFIYLVLALGQGYLGSINKDRALINSLRISNYYPDDASFTLLNGNPSRYRPAVEQLIFPLIEDKFNLFAFSSDLNNNNELGLNNLAKAKDTTYLDEESNDLPIKGYINPIYSEFTAFNGNAVTFKPSNAWGGGVVTVLPVGVYGASMTLSSTNLENNMGRIRIGIGANKNLRHWVAHMDFFRVDTLARNPKKSWEEPLVRIFHPFPNFPTRGYEVTINGDRGFTPLISRLSSTMAFCERVITANNSPQKFNFIPYLTGAGSLKEPITLAPVADYHETSMWFTPRELIGDYWDTLGDGGVVETKFIFEGILKKEVYNEQGTFVGVLDTPVSVETNSITVSKETRDLLVHFVLPIRPGITLLDTVRVAQRISGKPSIDIVIGADVPTPPSASGAVTITIDPAPAPDAESQDRTGSFRVGGGAAIPFVLEDYDPSKDYYLKAISSHNQPVTVSNVTQYVGDTRFSRIDDDLLTFESSDGEQALLKVFEDSPNTLENFSLFSPSAQYYANGIKFRVVSKNPKTRGIVVKPVITLPKEANIFRYWEAIYASKKEINSFIINFSGRFFSEPKPDADAQLSGRTGQKGKA